MIVLCTTLRQKNKVVYYKNMIPALIKDLYTRYNGAKISYPTYHAISPLENEIKEFVKAIKGKKEITYSGLESSIKVTKLLNLAEKSIALNGKPIYID